MTTVWNNVTTATRDLVIPEVVEQIKKGSPLRERLFANEELRDGGTMIRILLKYGEGPAYFFSGPKVHDTTNAEILAPAFFYWKRAAATASVDFFEELQNSGPEAIASIVVEKTQQMGLSMENLFGDGIFSDGSTNTDSITGLRAAVTGTGTTYGTISKTLNPFWRSYVDSTTVLANWDINAVTTFDLNITHGNVKPNLHVTTNAVYAQLYSTLTPNQIFMNQSMANAGFTALNINGIPTVIDEFCPANYWYSLNTDYLKMITHSRDNMKSSGWIQPYAQEVRGQWITWTGNMICNNCSLQAVATALA